MEELRVNLLVPHVLLAFIYQNTRWHYILSVGLVISDHPTSWPELNWVCIHVPCTTLSRDYVFCETQWPRPPLFSPSWLIQWTMGEGSYITLFSPSVVTAFHIIKYGGGVWYNLVFTEWRHCVSQNRMKPEELYIPSCGKGPWPQLRM